MERELIPHLFRTEFRKITTVLCKKFGIDHIEAAEDIASETFMRAYEIWTYQGVPTHPKAWLYAVAKNKAKNYYLRNNLYKNKITSQLKSELVDSLYTEVDLTEKNITDSQLQMLFALCQPSISTEAQIGLALRILCGFGIEEIANAFLSNKESINKRLFRAKERLRQEKVKIEMPTSSQITNRLDTVLTTLYLLYSEGYHSESNNSVLREELCLEAMRLTYLLIENENTNLPKVNALFALMCFHTSRFAARKNANGALILYNEQDDALWNQELITKGAYYLNCAAQGHDLSKYHLEASIAYWHTVKEDTTFKWQQILNLYNQLLMIAYTPIAAMNRTYALSKVKSKQEAIVEATKLNLHNNPYYHALLGELYIGHDDVLSKIHYETAYQLAKNPADKATLRRKLDA